MIVSCRSLHRPATGNWKVFPVRPVFQIVLGFGITRLFESLGRPGHELSPATPARRAAGRAALWIFGPLGWPCSAAGALPATHAEQMGGLLKCGDAGAAGESWEMRCRRHRQGDGG
eukprot:gene14422-biopygen17107